MANDFFKWWQHIPEHICPYILKVGSFEIRYYGLMYIAAFFTIYSLVMYRLKAEKFDYSKELIQDYFFWSILGVLIGGRLGYVLFYDPKYFIRHPWHIILPFDFSGGLHYTGIYGMSYHGGLLGVIVATAIFCYRKRIKLLRFLDFFVPAVPLGYTFGRIGNFINGELYGRITALKWGMYFPLDPAGALRHPSQLYEAFFEGVVLFTILWCIRRKQRFDGFLSMLYLIGYGSFRFLIEFVREPDPQLGFVVGFLTMGQILCGIMVIAGISGLVVLRKKGSYLHI